MAVLAVVLTCTAGYVDAVAYLRLGHIYVANMSGNSVSLGIHSVRRDWFGMARYVLPLLGFVAGALTSRMLVAFTVAREWRSVAAPSIAGEACALAAAAVLPAGGVFFVAWAMGVQAATLSRFNGVTVYTCFVTGSLVKFTDYCADFVNAMVGGRDPSTAWRGVAWFASIWAAYLAGGVLGAIAVDRIPAYSVPPAAAVLAMLAAMDLIWPARLDGAVPPSHS